MKRGNGLCFFALMMSSLSDARGADVVSSTRIMNFAGLSELRTTSGSVRAESAQAVCVIQVLNLDSDPQQIEGVYFGPSRASAIDSSFHGKNESSRICKLPRSLQKGESCTFSYLLNPIRVSQQTFSCAGSIAVKSVSTPGNVIASGAILSLGQMELLGGVLSGALYASGSHVSFNNATEKGTGISVVRNELDTHNMNVNCMASCVAHLGTGSNDFCQMHCGSVDPRAAYGRRGDGGRIQGEDASAILAAGYLSNAPRNTYRNSSPSLGRQYDQAFYRFPQKNVSVRMPILQGGCQDFLKTDNNTQETNCTVLVPNAQLSYMDISAPRHMSYMDISAPRHNVSGRLHPFSPPLTINSCSLFTGENSPQAPALQPSSMRAILGLDNVTGFAEGSTIERTVDTKNLSFSSNPPDLRGLYFPERLSRTDVDGDYLTVIDGNRDGKGTLRGPPDPTRAVGKVMPSISDALPSSVLTHGDSHFGGGMIYELTAGGASSICSANAQMMAAAGSSQRPHPHRALDIDTPSSGSPLGNLLSEGLGSDLLYCSHRHGTMDWVLSVGKVVPFVINAGMEF